jgi:hypothetical protein
MHMGSWRIALMLCFLGLARSAHAVGPTCASLDCPAQNIVAPCYTIISVCNCSSEPEQLKQPPPGTKGPKNRAKKPPAPQPGIPPDEFCECDQNPQINKAAGTACTDDGNPCTSDVCDGSGNCTHAGVANGTACTDDGNACTSDVCETSACAHLPETGAACTSDGNPCTTDVCDDTGACTHNNPTGGKVCASMCIAAATCCTNADCTAPANGSGVCSGAGGSCTTTCNGGYKACGAACIANATCCSNTDCSGGQVCSGVGGSCGCPGGTYACGATCIASSTCCNAPSNCPPPTSGTGTGVCSGVGGSCSLSCTGGKQCGSGCIPSTQCCVNADCPNDPANHRSGVCEAGGACTYACNSGYKVCGNTCIPTAQCCTSSDCTAPPSACYKSAGACNAGTCIYPFNDGAACNADDNACTPNDSCLSGSCVADTAHTVKCIQRACHTTPTCDTSTGDCVDQSVSDGSTCGGNGCTPAGTCTTGNCSAATKDCSQLSTQCQVGVCDPTLPTSNDCTTTPTMNGTACTLTDKCQLTTACSGGSCVGKPVTCTPKGPCYTAACNSATGNCDETLLAAGTSCASSDSCIQNASCDANGNCNGDPVPDATPCNKAGCTEASACVSGVCTCVDSPDLGGALKPIITTDDPDMASATHKKSHGCSINGVADAGSRSVLYALLGFLFFVVISRRRTRSRMRS